ncbi:MAG: HI0074 family nucleotidyltransferase substrate-binding subunit [Alphaproteobacteria bacterium]|nr:HI0074 family nucleotidyltransferase substrate-binding subunit [Alphaproteobacteria bacterium]
MVASGINVAVLRRAFNRLVEGLNRYRIDETDDQLRDGLIQRFEFTYELSHKLIRRVLADRAANRDDVMGLSFQGLIRLASDQGLISGDWPQWKQYRELRSKSSHLYEESAALSVIADLPTFIAEISELLERLEEQLR